MLPPSTSPVSNRLRELDERFVAQVAEVTRSELADHQRQLEEISPETGTLVDALAGYLEGSRCVRASLGRCRAPAGSPRRRRWMLSPATAPRSSSSRPQR